MRLRRAWFGVVLAAIVARVAGSPAQTPAGSGLDLSAIDASIRPQDDLYRHANGRWLQRTVMPP